MVPSFNATDESTGDVYVIDALNGVVDRFSASGTYLGQLTGSATTAGTLGIGGTNDDVAVDNSGGPTQGYVYVAGEQAGGPGMITAFDAAGRVRWQLGPINALPSDACGVAVDATGQLWAGDEIANAVQERSVTDGSPIGPRHTGTKHPCQFAFDSTGVAYIVRLTAGLIKYAPTINDPPVQIDVPDLDVAVDSTTNDVYSNHGTDISIFDSAGNQDPATPFDSGNLRGVAIDGAHGNIFVSDGNNNDVEMWARASGSPKPYVRGGAPSGVSGTGATLNARVNPAGASTTCQFDYVADAQFQIDGYASATTRSCDSAPGSGTSDVDVTGTIGGLSAGTTYHWRIEATNGAGTVRGADNTFTATATHTVTVVVNGTGTGSVDADSGAISGCTSNGGACSDSYTEGSALQLTASPDVHMRVTSMSVTSGNAAPTTCTSPTPTNPCSVTVNEDLAITVTIDKIQHTVRVSKGGTGSGRVTSSPAGIDCGATCSAPFDEGRVVTLTATADPTSTFAGWSGGGCSGTGTCRVTVNADTAVTATFNQNAPAVVTGGSSGITQAAATVNGTVNPNGANVTDCHADFGTSASYGSQAACASGPGSGTSAVPVSASLSNLSCGTTYHYRISATNSGGATNGADATFTTAACIVNPPPGCPLDPSKCTPGALKVANSHATVRGSIGLLKIACVGEAGGFCRQSLTFTATIKVKVKRGRRTVVKKKTIAVGKATCNLGNGASGTISIRLTSAAKSALKRSALVAKATGLQGTATLPKAKPARRKRKHKK